MTDAETSLRALLRSIARERHYEDDDDHIVIRSITSGGANYTSTLHLATLSTPGLPDLDLFAKVASISGKIRSQANGDNLYRTEHTFYNKLIKIWDGYQEKYQVPDRHKYVFPKYYGGSTEVGKETVVLENLVAQGYLNYNRFKSVDWEYASKAIEVLAKYHAMSFVFQKEDPEEFEAMTKDMEFLMPETDPSMKGLWERMVGGAMSVIEDPQHREKVGKFFQEAEGSNIFKKHHMPTHTPILTHGDYRPSNLLYKKQEDGSLQIIALDYQTIHTGCPVEDLVYFIIMGSDEEFRRQHYHQLVEHYYLQLSLALARFKINVEEVYPRHLFDDDLKEMMPYSLVIGVVILPVVTVEAESAPRMDAEELDSFVVAPNELFASRFKGVVNDLVRWGVI